MRSVWSNLKIHYSSGSLPHLEVEGGEEGARGKGGGGAKKGMKTLLVDSAFIRD